MATSNQGLFGIFSGRIGKLIGYNYKGRQAFRITPKKSTKPPTVAQQAQRFRFALAVHFLSPLKSIISKGYGNNRGKTSQTNQCNGYHTKHAIKGEFPDLEIDYSKVVLTTGRLCRVADVEMLSKRTSCIDFSWTNYIQPYMYSETDQAILVAYNPSQQRHQFIRTNSTRADQCATLEVPLAFSGHKVHCWMMFISPNGKEFSTSTYLGSVIVA